MRFRSTLLTLLTTLWLLVGCQTASPSTRVEATATTGESAAALSPSTSPTSPVRPASATATETEPTATEAEPTLTNPAPTISATHTPRPTRTPTVEPSHTATAPSIPATATAAVASATASTQPSVGQPTVVASPSSAAPTVVASASPAPVTATPIPASPTVALPSPTAVPPTAVPPVVEAPTSNSQPVRLIIPAIGVDAAVESVGLTSNNLMGVPEGVMNVAWYNLGAAPGQPGNAVFSGHLDDYKQDPAVFWDLGALEVGDVVIARDAAGNEYLYGVTGKEIYPFDQAPLNRIFGYTLSSNLNLITCNGIWHQANRNYDQRLVVYTQRLN